MTDLKPTRAFLVVLGACLGFVSSGASNTAAQDASPAQTENASGWITLFDGETLNGWTPKIAGYPMGENHAQTFRVEDGIIKCEYDDYEGPFDRRFGHLFTEMAYSHYILRMEYKFVGRMLPDAPHYVDLNSGVMIHAQPPQSMLIDQGFPVSLEMQFLADTGDGERNTGNVCTPGAHIVIDDELITQHIVQASTKARAADAWVSVEVEVRGHDEIIHRVNGQEVLRYQNPLLDPKDKRCGDYAARGANLKIGSGHIALQAEGQRVWFRNIKLRPLNN